MKKLFMLFIATVIFCGLYIQAFAQQKQVENVYFNQYAGGSLQANFTAEELIENGNLLIYKDNKTGYTATISIDEEYSSQDFYRADVYFEDDKAYTGFSFDFNPIDKSIYSVHSFYGRFPFRQLDIDLNTSPRLEKLYSGVNRIIVEFATRTKHSYVGQHCSIILYEDGVFDFNRSMLDSHAKGGYDGFTMKMALYDVIGLLPVFIVGTVIIVHYRKKHNKKEENRL